MGEYKNVPQEINDVVSDNIKKLAQLFPSAVKDGQLDIDALKEELGTFEEVGKEKYEFTWSGKQNAKKIAQQDVFGKTLKFCPEKSKNADTTENIYIEGDNLEALKLLRQNYYNSIKMIYIDPPYNTGNDFVYNDDYSMSQEESDIAEGVVDELGERYTKNISGNKFHANWCNMIYPRLKLAKELLSEQGVLVISIDDNEIENMKKCCNEIFGEGNLVNCFIWNCSTAGGIRPKFASKTHEYVLVYAKNKITLDMIYAPLSSDAIKMYTQKDDKGIYRDKDFVFKNKSNNINQKYGIECPDGEIVYPKDGYIYRFVRSKFDDALQEKIVTFKKTTTGPLVTENGEQAHWNIYIRKYLGEAMGAPSTLIPKEMMSIYNVGTQCVQDLFDGIRVFENVKPVDVITYLINMFSSINDTILDFFSGSATTAHAVMQLNAEDGGNRKFIMVQLPEVTDEKSEAHKAGYNTICEIGEERIRRAGDKIAEECQAKIDEYKSKLEVLANNPNGKGIPVEEDKPYPIPDIGFKVFKIADTNIKWNELELKDEQIDFANLSNNPDQVDFKQGTKDIDVVYEIMLRQKNIPLSSKVEVLDEIGSRTYLYADSYLICLETQITNEMIDKLASIDPTPFKYIFRDSAFKDDIDLKTNAFRRLKAMVEKHAGATKKAYTVEFI